MGIKLNKVVSIYSELEPCHLPSGGYGIGGCTKMIKDKLSPLVNIFYSYDYPGHDATTKPLRDIQIALRRKDFSQFKK